MDRKRSFIIQIRTNCYPKKRHSLHFTGRQVKCDRVPHSIFKIYKRILVRCENDCLPAKVRNQFLIFLANYLQFDLVKHVANIHDLQVLLLRLMLLTKLA